MNDVPTGPIRKNVGEDAARTAGPRRRPRWRLRTMMIGTVAVAVLCWAAIGSLAALLISGTALGPALTIGAVVAFVRRRTTRQEALLELLAVAAEAGVPTGPAIRAFADTCGGDFRRKLGDAAYRLDRGDSLPDALDAEPGVVPRGASSLIRVGWEVGAPARALRDAATAGASSRPLRRALAKAMAYALVLLTILQVVAAMVSTFHLPVLREILGLFGRPFPPLTEGVIRGTNALIRHWPLAALGASLELGMGALLLALLLQYVGGPEVSIPPFNRLTRRRHAAAVLRSLALVVEAGRPMDSGLAILSRSYPRAWVRRRLGRAEGRVRAGGDWLAALRAEGLVGRADAAVLESSQRAGNLAWAMRELAEGNERRLDYRLRAGSQAILPVVVLAFGSLIGLLAAAYILPLTTLIRDLAE